MATHVKFLAILLLLACASCKTQLVTQEKPVIVEHTTTQHHTDILRDTLIMRDSVSHYIHGDTTVIERWHHFREVTKLAITDTIRDTVPIVTQVVKTQVKEVPKKPPWWQKTLLAAAAATIIAAALALAYNLRKH